MKAIVVMHQETHHSGGIPLCILIIPECFAQNLEGIASADLSPLFAATVLISSKHLLSIEICNVVLPNSTCLCNVL